MHSDFFRLVLFSIGKHRNTQNWEHIFHLSGTKEEYFLCNVCNVLIIVYVNFLCQSSIHVAHFGLFYSATSREKYEFMGWQFFAFLSSSFFPHCEVDDVGMGTMILLRFES